MPRNSPPHELLRVCQLHDIVDSSLAGGVAIGNARPGEEAAGGQSGSVRHPVPPPGPRLEFAPWCRVLTAELRRYLPDVRASTNRRCNRVTWRHRDLFVTCTNDRGVFSIQTDPRFGGFHDAERHDFYRDHAGEVDLSASTQPSVSFSPRSLFV